MLSRNQRNVLEEAYKLLIKIHEEAPVDFLGTGSDGKWADKEEAKWRSEIMMMVSKIVHALGEQ